MTLWRKTFHGDPSGGEESPFVSGTQLSLDLTPLWRQEKLWGSSVILETNVSDTPSHRLAGGVRGFGVRLPDLYSSKR